MMHPTKPKPSPKRIQAGYNGTPISHLPTMTPYTSLSSATQWTPYLSAGTASRRIERAEQITLSVP